MDHRLRRVIWGAPYRRRRITDQHSMAGTAPTDYRFSKTLNAGPVQCSGRLGHIPALAHRSCEDLFDHFGFRGRIGVHVRPILSSQLPLHGLIKQAVFRASPKVVAESDVALELDAAQ